MFWNFKSMRAATVSSCGLMRVGPNTTPKFATVMRFCLEWFETLIRWKGVERSLVKRRGSGRGMSATLPFPTGKKPDSTGLSVRHCKSHAWQGITGGDPTCLPSSFLFFDALFNHSTILNNSMSMLSLCPWRPSFTVCSFLLRTLLLSPGRYTLVSRDSQTTWHLCKKHHHEHTELGQNTHTPLCSQQPGRLFSAALPPNSSLHSKVLSSKRPSITTLYSPKPNTYSLSLTLTEPFYHLPPDMIFICSLFIIFSLLERRYFTKTGTLSCSTMCSTNTSEGSWMNGSTAVEPLEAHNIFPPSVSFVCVWNTGYKTQCSSASSHL